MEREGGQAGELCQRLDSLGQPRNRRDREGVVHIGSVDEFLTDLVGSGRIWGKERSEMAASSMQRYADEYLLLLQQSLFESLRTAPSTLYLSLGSLIRSAIR